MATEALKPFLIRIYKQNRCKSAFRVSDSPPLVQLNFSLNTFCLQPETYQVLNTLPFRNKIWG